MNELSWMGPLKESVLVLFFLVFCGASLWALCLPNGQELASLPWNDKEEKP
jgi:hypothetical protein